MILSAQSQNIVIEKRFEEFSKAKFLMSIPLAFNMPLKCIDLILLSVSLTHSFPMQPFFTPWKHQKSLQFSDVFRG